MFILKKYEEGLTRDDRNNGWFQDEEGNFIDEKIWGLIDESESLSQFIKKVNNFFNDNTNCDITVMSYVKLNHQPGLSIRVFEPESLYNNHKSKYFTHNMLLPDLTNRTAIFLKWVYAILGETDTTVWPKHQCLLHEILFAEDNDEAESIMKLIIHILNNTASPIEIDIPRWINNAYVLGYQILQIPRKGETFTEYWKTEETAIISLSGMRH